MKLDNHPDDQIVSLYRMAVRSYLEDGGSARDMIELQGEMILRTFVRSIPEPDTNAFSPNMGRWGGERR